MTLFLASSGLTALTDYLPASPHELKLGFIATAAEVFDDRHWVEREQKHFKSLGFDVAGITPEATLDGFDVVFATGGNTYYLLQEMHAGGFDVALKSFLDRGGVYAGTSAGAIVCGPDIDITAEPDQRAAATRLETTTGLGLVPFSVLPHAGVDSPRFIAHHNRVLQNATSPVWRITDDEAIVVRDGQAEIIWSPRT